VRWESRIIDLFAVSKSSSNLVRPILLTNRTGRLFEERSGMDFYRYKMSPPGVLDALRPLSGGVSELGDMGEDPWKDMEDVLLLGELAYYADGA
jgi:hypothetical protein